MFRPSLINFCLHVLLPLIVGVSIYFVFRGIPFLGFHSFLNVSGNTPIMAFFLFNLPDGLWLFALLSAISQIWGESTKRWFWIITVFILAISSEFLQTLHIIPGTFDWYDIATYCCIFLIFNLLQSNFFITKLYFIL